MFEGVHCINNEKCVIKILKPVKTKKAPFDASSVDNMQRFVDHSGPQDHVYPLAILCHDIMPLPLKVEKEIKEKIIISFHGTGLSVAPEISFSTTVASCESL